MDRTPRLRERLPLLGGLVLLATYGVFLARHAVFSVGGSDAYAYASAARSFREGRILRRVEALRQLDLPASLDRLFIPLGAVPGRVPGTMVSVAPIGLPLHMAAAAWIAGPETGPFLVSPLAALATLVFIYLLGRELGLPVPWSLAGSAIFAAFPGFLRTALMPMTDALAVCWACAAMLCALRARRRIGSSALAGAAFAIGVLVRPTNALLAIPLLFALPAQWRAWRLFLAGGVPAALLWMSYNVLAFGNALVTGYGAIWSDMTLAFFGERLQHYVRWSWQLFSPLVLLGWVGCVLGRRVSARDRALLASWYGAFLLFYCGLRFHETGWETRYLLPGMPALVLGALLFARNVLASELFSGFARTALAVGALCLIIGTGIRFIIQTRIHEAQEQETFYSRASRFAEARFAPRALVVSMQMSGAVDYYTGRPCVLWNWIAPEGPPDPLLRSARAKGFEWYGLLAPFEVADARARVPGVWQPLGTVGDVTLWKIEPRMAEGSR